MCQYDNMPIEEKLQLIVCGTVELWNCGTIESLNLPSPMPMPVPVPSPSPMPVPPVTRNTKPGTRNPKPGTDEKPYNLLILTKKKSTSLLS